MIRVRLTPKPTILNTHASQWTSELMNLVTQYSGYSNIPKTQRNSVVNRYRNEEIQDAIEDITNGHCVFCGSSIGTVSYINIEHFLPKSVYPHLTFEWENLFPACQACNGKKLALDPNNPATLLIHPRNDAPESLLEYNGLNIQATTLDTANKGSFTIQKLALNTRLPLLRAKSQKLYLLFREIAPIQSKVLKVNSLTQNAAIKKHVLTLKHAIDYLKSLGNYDQEYPGLVRYFLRNDQTIQNAIQLINIHSNLIGLSSPYTLNW